MIGSYIKRKKKHRQRVNVQDGHFVVLPFMENILLLLSELTFLEHHFKYAPLSRMKLLLVDCLNIVMHRFPTLWNRSFSVMKAELIAFASACKEAGFMPLLVLDLYKQGNVGQQKWRRRQRKLFLRNRAVPCSASCLIGTILAETDIPWTYATTMEADDLIIEIAKQTDGCTILSGDKGYLRVCQRNFCVARSAQYSHGLVLSHVAHASNCHCEQYVIFPQIRLHQNISKIIFYLAELRNKRAMSKGVFYTSFNILPCMWCYMIQLRQHFYKTLQLPTVRESHVCASICQRTGQLTWDCNVVSAKEYIGDFVTLCQKFVRNYELISESFTHACASDHVNAVFACAVSIAQILTDMWYINRKKLGMLDSLTVSRVFSRNLNFLLQGINATRIPQKS